MSVLARSELEASPLADLHAIASQVGLEGFRRLRKAELIDAILGESTPTAEADGQGEREGDRPEAGERPRRRRPLRSRRSREDDEETPTSRRAGPMTIRSPRPRMTRTAPPPPPPPPRQRTAARELAVADDVAALAVARAPAPVPPTHPLAAAPAMTARTIPGRTPDGSPPVSSRCWATARLFCGLIRRSPPTRTCTSPPLRFVAASSSPETGSPGRCARRVAPSATRRWCVSTRSTGHRLTASQTEFATTSCRSTGQASAWRSARKTRRSRRSSG